MEKTNTEIARKLKIRKHLHGRGEDLGFQLFFLLGQETPPRTWRRLRPPQKSRTHHQKHLHGRGEDDRQTDDLLPVLGNTSTDVEKTRSQYLELVRVRKHLHGRGEDLFVLIWKFPTLETPPRTWRRRTTRGLGSAFERNTSTDVEKTCARTAFRINRKKHLHGRGEDNSSARSPLPLLETPPRTWRRQKRRSASAWSTRNTSTDVEKTTIGYGWTHGVQKHLHGRGEDSKIWH